MLGLRRKLSENLAIFVLASFAFVSILGVGIGMEMTDSQMSSCPFMAGQTTMCQMSVTEHITQWQEAFLGIPTKTNLLALAMVLLTVVVIPFVKPFSQFEKLTELAARLFAYHKAHFVKIFDPFLLAFSDGILNPKIYEPAAFNTCGALPTRYWSWQKRSPQVFLIGKYLIKNHDFTGEQITEVWNLSDGCGGDSEHHH